MDGKKGKWDWLPAAMPTVTRLIAEKRRAYGSAHVAECWRRGVVQLEPGWMWAREAGLAVGTPPADPAIMQMAYATISPDQAFLYMREPGGTADGAH